MSTQDSSKTGLRRCAEGCHWVSRHVPDAPVWVNICSLCGTIDGNDLRMQIDEILTALREKLEAEHPEARCRRCHTPNCTDWSAPSPLWNQVMRGGDIGGVEAFSGIVCPTCFMILAQGLGIASRWRLAAERVHVPLQTVDPSGRVWNEQTWLWGDPAGSQAKS